MTDPRPDAPILVINLGWEQRRLVEAAFETGRPVVGVHPEESEVPDLPFARVLIAGPRDLGSILSLAREIRPLAVVADQCDYSHFAMAMVCEELELPGPRVAQAQLGCNKHLSRERAESQVRQPRFELCRDLAEARRARERLLRRPRDGRVVVKPVDNRGSFGVNVVDDDGALGPAVSKAIEHAHSRLFLVEEFVTGRSIIIEGYVFPTGYRSLVLGAKTHLEERPQIHLDASFEADGAFASGDEERDRVHQAAMRTNDRVAAAMGFDHGMTSAEYVVDDRGDAWLVEIANRGAGVCISSLVVPWVSGIDTTTQLVLDGLASGRDLSADADTEARAAILSYFVLEPGELAEVSGLEAARRSDGMLSMRYWGPRTGRIEWPEDALGRQGMMIVGGDDLEAARDRVERARGRIEARYV